MSTKGSVQSDRPPCTVGGLAHSSGNNSKAIAAECGPEEGDGGEGGEGFPDAVVVIVWSCVASRRPTSGKILGRNDKKEIYESGIVPSHRIVFLKVPRADLCDNHSYV